MMMKLILCSVDMNIHVCAKLAGHDAAKGNYAKR